jgi:hypothetical protein
MNVTTTEGEVIVDGMDAEYEPVYIPPAGMIEMPHESSEVEKLFPFTEVERKKDV